MWREMTFSSSFLGRRPELSSEKPPNSEFLDESWQKFNESVREDFFRQNWPGFSHPRPLSFVGKLHCHLEDHWELASVYKERHAKRWLLDCVSKEKHSCFCLLLISSRPTFMFRFFLSLLFHHRHTWECCRERKILHILPSKLFQFSLTKTVFVLRKLTILHTNPFTLAKFCTNSF